MLPHEGHDVACIGWILVDAAIVAGMLFNR